MRALSNKEDYRRKVEIGYRKMKDYRVAICSVVRDCERNLRANIPTINKLKDHFRESHVVVFENDSKDGTKEVLFKWSKAISNVHILTEDIGVDSIPKVSSKIRPWFSCHRIKLMASFRNRYMEFIEKNNWGLEYVIIVDLDLEHISIDGIANTFGQDIDWHAVSSNGKNITIKNLNKGYFYYDTYAFREIRDTRAQTEEIISTYQNLLSGLVVGMPMIRVSSAFNGLCVYKYEAIKGIRYRCKKNNDEQVEALSEHVTFHWDMAKKGYDLIFINPSQELYYKTLSEAIKEIPAKVARNFHRLKSSK